MPETPETTMGRLDERLKGLEKKTDDHHNTVMNELKDIKENINPRLLSLENRIFTKGDFSEFYKSNVTALDEKVNKEEFNTIKLIVYGMVGTILLAFIGALIKGVIKT